MGQSIAQTQYTEQDYSVFNQVLVHQLATLKSTIDEVNFGNEEQMLGAELEMYLVNDKGQVDLSNLSLIEALDDPQFQPELNQYNVELNLSPVSQKGTPFSHLEAEIHAKMQKLDSIAKPQGISIVPIGILPSLEHRHLHQDFMTDIPRYHCLSKSLYEQRGEAFQVNINGEQSLSVSFEDICAEGANTSFQVHLMTKPDRFASVYNAALLTAPLVTAISANSSVLLGKRLWHETRIALFKQSLDCRLQEEYPWQQPTRVSFGNGWCRHSPFELFAEAVALYPAIIPQCEEYTTETTQSGQPKLKELNLHMGTIWPWLRPVYSASGNGHIRLEFRAIPAGPTPVDMVANAAFAIGLAIGLADQVEDLICTLPFRFAEYNFYRAAQHGLNAKILWPLVDAHRPAETDITETLWRHLPAARKGLAMLGVDASDIDHYIGIIEQRLTEKMTGAIWQIEMLKHLQQTGCDHACDQLVTLYLKQCQSNKAVATWERLWQ